MYSAAHALHRRGTCWDRLLELDTVNLESVVIVDPVRSDECRPLVCTHRPSHCPSKLVSEVVTRCPHWKVRMDTFLTAALIGNLGCRSARSFIEDAFTSGLPSLSHPLLGLLQGRFVSGYGLRYWLRSHHHQRIRFLVGYGLRSLLLSLE